MSLIRKTDIDDPYNSIYGCGQCHIHAIAASRVHCKSEDDFRFLIITDYDHPGAVIHVYSIHEVDGHEIARDVLGDRLLEDAEAEAAEAFDLYEPDSYECLLSDLMDLTQGQDQDETCCEKPLCEILEQDVVDAMRESSVTADVLSCIQRGMHCRTNVIEKDFNDLIAKNEKTEDISP